MGVFGIVADILTYIWDVVLDVTNIFLPNIDKGSVISPGHPGAGGKWPKYISPKVGDSRSPCPALNVLANHGIINRDGKNISFKDLRRLMIEVYNFSPTFARTLANYSSGKLKMEIFDLADSAAHNKTEHDASMCRDDMIRQADQGKPHLPFIEDLLSHATGYDSEGYKVLTGADISRFSSKRRAESRATNPEYKMTMEYKFLGTSNACIFLTVFGGRVEDLRAFLIDERLPDGWEPKVRSRLGFTMAALARVVIPVELGVNEKAVHVGHKDD